jgi:hypothetical protein
MLAILVIAVGFALVSLMMLVNDRLRARRITPIRWTTLLPTAVSAHLPNVAPLREHSRLAATQVPISAAR